MEFMETTGPTGGISDPAMGIVPPGWALKPAAIGRGEMFRLLFITTAKRDATESNIAIYNRFVQDAAAAGGHAAIRAYSAGFRVLASTEAVDARDNTATTGTGVPIYWLNGNKLADDYADLYDGSWDDESNRTNETGGSEGDQIVWSGSTDDGREAFHSRVTGLAGSEVIITTPIPLGAAGSSTSGRLQAGVLNSIGGPFSHVALVDGTTSLPFYALSQVLMTPAAKVTALRVVSTPNHVTYRVGETVAVAAAFSEPVTVRGTPLLDLELDSGVAAARYVSGSGTATLRFEYAVREGDHDGDGFDIVIAADREGPFRLDGSTVRALAHNSEADLAWKTSLNSGRGHRIEARPPEVETVEIRSRPASGGTYAAGETITLRLTLRDPGHQAVVVTGRPYVHLDVGGVPRRADYAGPVGTATEHLDFAYTVRAEDFDADGVNICTASVSGVRCWRIHLNGGSIRAWQGGLAASLGHPAQSAQAGHKVDGTPAPPPPAVSGSCSDEIKVPNGWALKPSGLGVGSRFRLLFITSGERDANPTGIGTYNGFVQGRAGAGHSAIRRYRSGFRAVGSTQTVSAINNTCTTGTGVPIYWLNGAKVANNYPDFYDDRWENNTGGRNEHGNGRAQKNTWTGSNPNGSIRSGAYLGFGPSPDSQVQVGRAGVNAFDFATSPLSDRTNRKGRSLPLYGLSQVFRVGVAMTTGAVIVSRPAVGNTYRRGERIEIAVEFSEAVTVRGAPRLIIAFGDDAANLRGQRAGYLHGSGTTRLVFGYTVAPGIRDTTGFQFSDPPFELQGASIRGVADGFEAALTIAAWSALRTAANRAQNVDGRLEPATGGVCERSPAVRDWIVAAAQGFDPAPADCRAVTADHLFSLTGAATVSGAVALKAGDFIGLSRVDSVTITGLTDLPAGVFQGLGGARTLTLSGNALSRLEKGAFRGLPNLETLDLSNNRLAAGSLEDGVFEPLTELTALDLGGNPGSATFVPGADAGEGRTMDAGERATPGGPGTRGGPWGSNVTHAWEEVDADGNAVADADRVLPLTATDVARPAFTAPALAAAATVRLRLTVTGLPDVAVASTATFTILPNALTGLTVVSAPQAGTTYGEGERIQVAASFSAAVEVTGRPTLGLEVGGETRQALYVSGSGTQTLVFSYTVRAADRAADGVAVPANALATPPGSAITNAHGATPLLAHDALAASALTGGICDRTPQVRDAIVAAVSEASDCSEVTPAHLAGITGQLRLDSTGITGLKPGDFAGLSGVGVLWLSDNALTALPAGVFDGLGALTTLYLLNNQLAAGGLADGVFEPLSRLLELDLRENPGSATFLPLADAGADRTVGAGAAVTLGGKGAGGGPWGTNATYRWVEVDANGDRVADADRAAPLSDAGTAKAGFTAPALAAERVLHYRLSVQGKGHGGSDDYTAADTVAVTVRAAPLVTGVAIASIPRADATYRQGEAIEVAATFNRAVEVTGTPTLGLAVGADTANRSAAYVRGSGTRTLVFAYTVIAGDDDDDGIAVPANGLATPAGSAILDADGAAVSLAHTALAADAAHRVDGATAALTGGICGRTAQVRNAIVAAVDAASDCSEVTPAHLAGITGQLRLDSTGITGLKPGDFAGLSGVGVLWLSDNALTALPAGVFDGLGALTTLYLLNNQLAAGGLADGVFEPLSRLLELDLRENPGSATFLPLADAGADRTVGAGAAVTLGGKGAGGGPWGTNATYRWVEVDANGDRVADANRAAPLSDAGTAKAGFTAPVLAAEQVLHYRLSVQGKGHGGSDDYTAADTVAVTVRAAPLVTGVAITSVPRADATYRAGEAIEVGVTFNRAVEVTGTPTLGLAIGPAIGAQTKPALYVRGSGTRRLVFAYTVQDTDADTDDGVAVPADALATPAGSAILEADGAAVSLAHAALAADAAHRVDGSTPALTGGVCERTPQVRDKLVELVQAADSTVTDCSLVTTEHLGELDGSLILVNAGIAGLKAGDFADLGGVTGLLLNDNALTALAAGVFDGLGSERTPFRTLILTDNALAAGSLADGVFEALVGVDQIALGGNPGSASFVPLADAGGPLTVGAGRAATLGGEGTGGGPWGTNVEYLWVEIDADGNAVADAAPPLMDADTAQARFEEAPVAAAETVLRYRLRVRGKGYGHRTSTAHSAVDTVAVTVRAAPLVTGVAIASTAAGGRDLPGGRGDRGRGDLQRAGRGHGRADAGARDRHGYGEPDRRLRPRQRDADAGVRLHGAGHGRRRRRHRGAGERHRGARQRDLREGQRGCDPRPRRARGEPGAQGGRIDGGAHRRGVRAHGPGARRAGRGGAGEQQRGHELLAGDDRSSRRAGRHAGRGQRGHRGAQGRGLRGSRQADRAAAERQRADRPAGGAVRRAGRAAAALSALQRSRPGRRPAQDLRAADEAHRARPDGQSGLRELRAVGGRRRGARGRGGRSGDARRPGPGQGPVGDECHLCLGRGRRRRGQSGGGRGPGGRPRGQGQGGEAVVRGAGAGGAAGALFPADGAGQGPWRDGALQRHGHRRGHGRGRAGADRGGADLAGADLQDRRQDRGDGDLRRAGRCDDDPDGPAAARP